MFADSSATPMETPPSAPSGKERRLSALADRAYRAIKAMVVENRVHGGEYLLEEELARSLGMSRTPVREASVQLQNEGLIEIVPRRGIRVVPLTVADIREIHDLMQWLESQAVSTLAARGDRAPHVARLEAHVAAMRNALASGDITAWARSNDRFHTDLVASAGNGRLVRICENLLDQTQRVRTFTLRLREPPNRTTDAHTAMLRAIADGDGERAAAIQVANKQAWLAELMSIVERCNLRHV